MKDSTVLQLAPTAPVAASAVAPGPKVPIPVPSKDAIDVPSNVQKQPWNTKNLGLRLAADFTSAACAASMVAPLISIIDRSIMENASGRNTLVASLKASFRALLLRPHTMLFSKPVALIFMLYGGTYLTANTLDTATSTARNASATHVTSGTPKFAASSAANVGLCIFKDQVYVKMFGPGGPPRPVPLPSYALFALRDSLTIFASFNVPPLLGPVLTARMSAEVNRTVSGTTVAQFVAPAAVQLLSTPIHLLGLDLYNRPATGGVGWAERWALVRKNWLISTAARICRIVPAFGVGGTVNMKVRKNLMERLV
ncbi:Uu.00g054440.m01.CDS01 [Anthostomella pinea]|uniref:Uu.00g054440.m01.CDS01 n=1 Tax=Anthostomella pinea TaxID=933095 RepID=A0AAI8VWL9_9PEZI|nr:Uu.00g054440.m01.CDS01 [Anthostomella pinea]